MISGADKSRSAGFARRRSSSRCQTRASIRRAARPCAFPLSDRAGGQRDKAAHRNRHRLDVAERTASFLNGEVMSGPRLVMVASSAPQLAANFRSCATQAGRNRRALAGNGRCVPEGGRLVDFGRMIFLRIAELAMAVAAYDRSKIIVRASRNMMRFEAAPIGFAADDAARIVCSKSVESCLPASFAFAFIFRPFS